MKKRILSLFLSAVILLGLSAVGVSAESVLTISDEGIRILKAEEGFSEKPYWDYSQWTVGYGTACPEDKREYFTQNGITEAEAEELLKAHLARFEGELYKFMNKTGVMLNQNQFDALMLFSYNCGSSWSYESTGTLYNAIVGRKTGNELIYALSRWCNAGGQIKTYLLRRRLSEANIYLNGVYSQTPPENYGYVLYDACGGVSQPNVQGYDTLLTATPIPTPTYAGHTFQGWYTQRVGGQQVTVLDGAVKNSRLYAHWLDAQGQDPSQETAGSVTVTVTGNGVNLREGPGTDSKVVGTANAGQQLVITETAVATGYTWGKFSGGWICLDYTNYDAIREKPEEPKEPEKPGEPEAEPIKTGTVKVNDALRVRSGPSTGYSVVGSLKNGTKVEILEEKTAGIMRWGRISQGWISLDYVVLDEQEAPVPPATQPPETQPPTTQPPETTAPETQPEEIYRPWTGTVQVKDVLRIRSGPGTSYTVVGFLYPNAEVTITAEETGNGMTWGKTDKGWVSLDYVAGEKTDSSPDTAEQTVTGTVKVNDVLRIRSGPGTSYAIAGYLSAGEKVAITQRQTVGSTVWGKISKGWVSMDYIVTEATGNGSQPEKMIRTVTADCLRVRSAAGITHTIVGFLYAGAKVEITDTTTVGGTVWGKTDKGWISLDYVA